MSSELPPDFFNRPLAEVDPEIADVLQSTEAAVRQLVSRARKHMTSDRRAPVAAVAQRELLTAFVAAARSGDMAALERLRHRAGEIRRHVFTLCWRQKRELIGIYQSQFRASPSALHFRPAAFPLVVRSSFLTERSGAIPGWGRRRSNCLVGRHRHTRCRWLKRG